MWGEDSGLPARAPKRRGRRPAKPRPRKHPFACSGESLAGALEALATPLGPGAQVERKMRLVLPSSDDLRFLAEAGKLGLELLARGRVLPGLVWREEGWFAEGLARRSSSAITTLDHCVPPVQRAASRSCAYLRPRSGSPVENVAMSARVTIRPPPPQVPSGTSGVKTQTRIGSRS